MLVAGGRPCRSRGLSLESSPGWGRACREGSRVERLGGCREYTPVIVTVAGRGQEPAAHTEEDEEDEEEGGDGGGWEGVWLLLGDRKIER